VRYVAFDSDSRDFKLDYSEFQFPNTARLGHFDNYIKRVAA
jgi:hypothetical protein